MSDPSTILIVDDEKSACETIEAQLYSLPYRLVFAHSGVDAFDHLGRNDVDLIVSDVMMPGVDGFEVCRRVKAHPVWRLIPVVLVTALDGRDDLVRGLECGADEFMSKPIDRVVLRARIRTMLRIRHNYVELGARRLDIDELPRTRRERLIEDAGLSPREREVLELLLLGRTHDDVAGVLGITVRTAKFHQANILAKVGAESRFDLVRVFL